MIEGTGTISQEVNFIKGGEYQLSFKAADCYWNAVCGGGTNPIMIQIDGVTVGTLTPGSLDYQTYTTDAFSVSSGKHILTLQGTMDSQGNRRNVHRRSGDRRGEKRSGQRQRI